MDTEKRNSTAVVFPGAITDKSWCQFGYEGLIRVKKEKGYLTAYRESVLQDDQLEVIREFAQQGFETIIGHGGEFSESIRTAAEEFPKIRFGVANGSVAGNNVSSMKLCYSQMGFLRGVLAGEMTRTMKVGMVSSSKLPTIIKDEDAFIQGTQMYGKRVEVVFAYTGDMEDAERARTMSLELIKDGVDVLTHHLDCADAGVIAAAEELNVYAIGLYHDARPLGPKAVIGSALGSPGTLVYELACGNVPAGSISYMDITTPNGVDIDMTDLVPRGVQEKMKDIVHQMRTGKLQIEP